MTKRWGGFSLAETIVAFAVLTGAIALLLPALHTPGAQTKARVERMLAEDFARSLVAELETFGAVTPGQTMGEESGWRWRRTVRSVTFSGSSMRGARVEVEVFDAAGRTRLARVEAYR